MSEETKNVIEETEISEVTVDSAVTTDNEEQVDRTIVKTLSPSKLIARRFFRSKLSIVGLVMIAFLFLFSFVGPLFSPYGEVERTFASREVNTVFTYVSVDPETNEVTKSYEIRSATATGLTYPTGKNWLGTDKYSFDVLTRLMYGGRISLTISFIAIILELALGVLLGGLAGYFGGWVDQLIMRVVDILSCIPGLPLMLICGAVLDSFEVPSGDKLYWLIAILTFFSWGGTARLVRGQILSLREQEFMLAAESTGLSASRKIFKHLIPNVMPQLIVSATLGLGSMILYESTLSYLGMGVPFPYAAWGSMINDASPTSGTGRTILQFYPNLWIPAGILIVLAVLGFNFVGDGLRDAFDPKMKR